MRCGAIVVVTCVNYRWAKDPAACAVHRLFWILNGLRYHFEHASLPFCLESDWVAKPDYERTSFSTSWLSKCFFIMNCRLTFFLFLGSIQIMDNTTIDYRRLLKIALLADLDAEGHCWQGETEITGSEPLTKVEQEALDEVLIEIGNPRS